jgi:tetratricopeptide (TPR) repeat protein
MNDTFKFKDSMLCLDCSKKTAAEQKKLPAGAFQRQMDPAICINCAKDHGSMSLPLLAGLPVCPQCEEFFRHRPFPVWVRAFLVAILALVVFATVWNMRYIEAYVKMRSAFKNSPANPEISVRLLESASNLVPENTELRGWENFYQGLLFLKQEKYSQALDAFNSCKKLLPQMRNENNELDYLTSVADAGVAFNNKDYDKFLAIAIDSSKKNPDNIIAVERVAAAYACKFVVTGDEQFKKQALDALEKAKRMQIYEYDSNEYEQRILHRLYTREIINGIEFRKKFPNGWTQPETQTKE